METTYFELTNYIHLGFLLMGNLFVFALNKRRTKITCLFLSVILSAAVFYLMAELSSFSGFYVRHNIAITFLFYLSYLMLLTFVFSKKVDISAIPFYGMIGFAGFTLLATDNLFILLIAFEITFVSTLLISFKLGHKVKDVYSYFVFTTFATVLLIIGLATLYLKTSESSISALMSSDFHPAMYLILLGMMMKIGLFPFHVRFFNIIKSNDFQLIATYFIFWIPVVVHAIIRIHLIDARFASSFFYPVVFLFIMIPNLLAFRSRKVKGSVLLILLASFYSVLLLNGYQNIIDIFIKNYINYVLVLFGLLMIISKSNKSEDDLMFVTKLDYFLFLLLFASGLGISFTWKFWIELEIYRYLLSSGLLLVIIVLFIHNLLALFNAASSSAFVLKIEPSGEAIFSKHTLYLLFGSLFVIYATCFPQAIDRALNYFLGRSL